MMSHPLSAPQTGNVAITAGAARPSGIWPSVIIRSALLLYQLQQREEAGWGGAGEGVQAGTQLQPRYSWKKRAQQLYMRNSGEGGNVYDVSML